MTLAAFRHRLAEILPPQAVRLLRLARTEAAALGAFLVMAMGSLFFLELAEEMAEQGDRGLDYRVLAALRVPGDAGNPIGPWWVEEAAADLTSLGGISVLSRSNSDRSLRCEATFWSRHGSMHFQNCRTAFLRFHSRPCNR